MRASWLWAGSASFFCHSPCPVGPPFGILTYPVGRVGVIHWSAWKGNSAKFTSVFSDSSPVHRQFTPYTSPRLGCRRGRAMLRSSFPFRMFPAPLPIRSPWASECVEVEFSEVHIHHPEYQSLSGWCYAAFSRSHG